MTIASLATSPELVQGALAGDARALERLLIVCRPDLERYARRHCESDDVDEAVQDALWILHRKVGGLRSVAALAGWLFQVVRRACLGYTRQRRRRAHVSIDAVSAEAEQDRTAADPELRRRLTAIIAALPGPYREVLILKDVQGHSAEEISVSLSISPEAAKSRLHRARTMVRDELRDGQPGHVAAA